MKSENILKELTKRKFAVEKKDGLVICEKDDILVKLEDADIVKDIHVGLTSRPDLFPLVECKTITKMCKFI